MKKFAALGFLLLQLALSVMVVVCFSHPSGVWNGRFDEVLMLAFVASLGWNAVDGIPLSNRAFRVGGIVLKTALAVVFAYCLTTVVMLMRLT
jgi:hypothetical protein